MRAYAVLVALIVAGCATQSTPPGPPGYQVGYAHGCDSGYREAGHPYYTAKRDWNAYQSDALYRQGFDEGRGACFAQYSRLR